MYSIERLHAITDLNLDGAAMTDVQFERYYQHLNTFIDNFPAQADNIRDHLDAEDYVALAKDLSHLSDTLRRLHAQDLAQLCRKHADEIISSGGEGNDTIEALVENMLLSVSSLSIDIQMASERGATQAAPQEPQTAPAPPPKFTAKKPGVPLILAVDNSVMFLNTIKKLLSDAPYELHCVSSGAQALDYIQSNCPDLFLLDVEMPGMDGYTLAQKIKTSGQSAPIVFITANSAREYVDRAIDVGGAGLLMKPVRLNQLLAKIKEFI